MKEQIKVTGNKYLMKALIEVMHEKGWKPIGMSTDESIIRGTALATYSDRTYAANGRSMNKVYSLPEQWVEVINMISAVEEPDWEIQALHGINTNHKEEILSDPDNIASWLKGYSKDGWAIHSVENTKTGEVLTVGDWVERNIEGAKNPSYKPHQIQKFIINEYNHCLVYTEQYKKGINIGKVHKVAEPREVIMVTEDGVEITNRETWLYGVHPKNYCIYNQWAKSISKDTEYKWLSTEEARKSWTAENKPMYSMVDIRKAVNTWGPTVAKSIIEKLKEHRE